MNELLDRLEPHNAPNETLESKEDDGQQTTALQLNAPIQAVEFNPSELEPAWWDYPCEWKRPRFAHIPHEIDWAKLYELRQPRRGVSAPTKLDVSTAAAPMTGAK